jgi:hypothetical protein
MISIRRSQKNQEKVMPPIIPAIGTAATTTIPILAVATGAARNWVMGRPWYNSTGPTYTPVVGRSSNFKMNTYHKNGRGKGWWSAQYRAGKVRVYSKKYKKYIWVKRRY